MPGTGVLFTLPDDPAAAPAVECPPAPVRPAAPDVFGEVAVPIRSKMPGSEWDRLTNASLGTADGPWSEMLAQARDIPEQARLDRVNRWVNWHVRYVEDPDGDVWSPAGETLRRGTGDCEDYAIAKMALLQRLGIPADDMFLVIVRQVHGQGDHAMLVVRNEGAMYVLDNRTDTMLTDSKVSDYLPVLSFTGPFEWIYGKMTEALRRVYPIPR